MTIKASTYRTVSLPSLQVMGIKVNRFPEDVQSTFDSLEKKILKKSQRKMLGALNVSNDIPEYKACIEQSEIDNPAFLGLESYLLPGGKYISGKLINWTLNTHLIKEMFGEMSHKYLFDATRPQLEYYKSKRELILMLPIMPREEQLKLEF
jgi:hypothetical protein